MSHAVSIFRGLDYAGGALPVFWGSPGIVFHLLVFTRKSFLIQEFLNFCILLGIFAMFDFHSDTPMIFQV